MGDSPSGGWAACPSPCTSGTRRRRCFRRRQWRHDARSPLARGSEHAGVSHGVEARGRHGGGEPAEQRERIEIDRERAVAERALQHQAHQVVARRAGRARRRWAGGGCSGRALRVRRRRWRWRWWRRAARSRRSAAHRPSVTSRRAVVAQPDGLAAAQRGSSGHGAERGGDGEPGQRGLARRRALASAADGVVCDHALASQQREDARPRDLQARRRRRRWSGRAARGTRARRPARLRRTPHPARACGSADSAQVARDALHGGDGAALAALDAARLRCGGGTSRAPSRRTRGTRRRELAVVGEPRAQLERQRQHPLAQRRSGRQHVLDEIGGGGRHAPAGSRAPARRSGAPGRAFRPALVGPRRAAPASTAHRQALWNGGGQP